MAITSGRGIVRRSAMAVDDILLIGRLLLQMVMTGEDNDVCLPAFRVFFSAVCACARHGCHGT